MALDQPHDKFFKAAFSNHDVLTDFVQAFLPATLVAKLDFSTLERQNETYLADELNEYYVDLLFTVKVNDGDVQLALLFEHKSYVETYPHFQINQYMLNYWNRQAGNGQSLTPILPIIIYHGERQWIKRPIPDYFANIDPELTIYVPSFDYVLINLADVTHNGLTLLRTDYAKLTALLLQNSRNQQRLLRVFEEFANLFKRLAHEASGHDFISASFLYIYWTTDLNKSQVVAIFQRISRQTGQTAMTTAERLINEGIEKGIEQGLDIASLRYVKGLLKLGMDANTISGALELPLDEVKQIIKRIKSQEK